MRWLGSALSLALTAACASAQTTAITCTVAEAGRTLGTEVRETSGLAVSRQHAGIFWTHNDSGADPELFALDSAGVVKAKVPVAGATLEDWEDMEAGACDGGHCLFVADIGDNFGRRSAITIYEISEPALSARQATVRRVITGSYEDGPQDAEALFVLPSGQIFIVSKGRHRAVTLYRLDLPSGSTRGTFRRVRDIAPHPADEADRVTAASASPNGAWVAIRSYRTLWVYRTSDLLADGVPTVTFPTRELNERQGEAITLDDQGHLLSTSEAEQGDALPTLARLRCPLP
jgi:hypothetical protein